MGARMTDPAVPPSGADLEAFVRAVAGSADPPPRRGPGRRGATPPTCRSRCSTWSWPPIPPRCGGGADRRPGRPDDRPRPALAVVGDAGTRTATGSVEALGHSPRGSRRCRDVRRAGRAGGPRSATCVSARRADDRTHTRTGRLHGRVGDAGVPQGTDGQLFISAMDPELFVHLLAWEDDVPVGCGTVFLDAGTAGVYNIAVPRRRAAAASGTP